MISRRRRFTPLPTAPLPSEEISMGRVLGMGGTLAVLFALLIGRLWLLQMVRGDEYRERALLNRSRTMRTTAPRGIIKDSKGRTLVANATQFAVFLRPDEMPRPAKLPKVKTAKGKKGAGKTPASPEPTVDVPLNPVTDKPLDPVTKAYLEQVARLVEVPVEVLFTTIKKKRGMPNDPIPIRENIDRGLMARLYEHQDDLPGLAVEVVPIRSYPFPNLATHILGFTGSVSSDELKDEKIVAYPPEKKYRSGDLIGKQGLERFYDLYLRGTLGNEAFEVDGKGRRRKEIGKVPAKAGATLVLALDKQVQDVAEKMLVGKVGAVVALDPRDGSVLAMASTPTYDLNLRTQRLTNEEYKTKVGGGETNRAISPFPPGSTFKLITSVAGLAEEKITPYSTITCAGGKFIGKQWKRCDGTHGGIELTGAIARSCDTYFYTVGERLGPTKLAAWGHKFGLGETPTLDMPVYSWSQGIVPDPTYKKKKAAGWNRRFANKMSPQWMGGDTANMSIGQGDVNATPLQMASVAATIANGGTVWEPHFVKKAVDADDPTQVLYEVQPKVVSTLGVKSSVLEAVRQGMRACVQSGTSTKAQVGGGIEVAGKSGSAEKRGGRGGGKGANYGWFTCYAQRHGEPATIAVCVFLEPTKGENYYGGDAAAPIAREVIQAHFRKDTPPAEKPTDKAKEKDEVGPSRRRHSRR
ncbi:penicillin-binding transpeptidase domain-containing protein [Armatimonas rosea]|uniref:Penicillin-binding protein 2 n=1 Tax=Armatimonas rosea TaxID=685828 RepID=A0A7W9SP28_ARMRO|nr:penicillin-binding transpeptidase domain-containing protein [Armatimonas rosea]MBB6049553.1 penicillin-binding protein 2 [Armatimonas rosea]